MGFDDKLENAKIDAEGKAKEAAGKATDDERMEAEGSTGSGANIMDFPHDAHRALIADFLEACRMGRPPAVSGEEALESQRWVERILARAAESG